MKASAKDSAQLRRAATAVALRVSLAIASMVIVLIVAAALYMLYRAGHPEVDASDRASVVYVESNDMLKAMAVAGLVGVISAGVIGWLSARSAIRPLSDALSLQRRFVQDASHELRTPLTILDTRIQLAQQTVNPAADSAGILDQLREDSSNLNAILEELLMAALAEESGADAGAQGPVNVALVVQQIASSYSALTASKDIKLQTRVSDNLHVRVAENRLRRAVSALVDNAINHSENGGTVCVLVSASAKTVEIRVSDKGKGITGIEPSQIFERFARSTDKPPQGRNSFGIGLALVSEIATAAGGSVSVESTSPQGTTMMLRLPKARGQAVT